MRTPHPCHPADSARPRPPRGARCDGHRPPLPGVEDCPDACDGPGDTRGDDVTRALVASGPGELAVRDVTLRALGPDDVRVRIAGVGVCHSDLSMVNGTLRPSYPLVLGHEASGVVTEAGATAGVDVGQHVVLHWAVPCDTCWHCTHGQPWLCSTIEGSTGGPGGTLADGTPYDACLGLGAMADEVVIAASAIVPLPGDVPLEEAALLGCAILTGVG